MASKRNVHVTLSQDMLREIDRSAAEANRTRSQEIEHQYMAGRRRLAELERLAAQTLAQASPAPGTAAAAHLAQHRRLSGFGPSNEDSDDV